MKTESAQIASQNGLFEFSSLVVRQTGPHLLYAFVISAKLLGKLVRINRRDTDTDEGYQRILSTSRVKAIAKFIDEKNLIPNSILVAFDDPEVRTSESGKTLYIPNRENVGWVIDGQHRLAGAQEAKNDIELLVIAFLAIDIKEQIHQFVVINREAKGVPTSLYLDLLRTLPPRTSPAEEANFRATDIINSLRKDEESPFFQRVVITSPKKGQLSLTNMVRKIAPLVTPGKGKFSVYKFNEQVGVLLNYFKALETIFPMEFYENRATFYKTLGFGAAMNLLPLVFDLSLRRYSGFQISDAANILRQIDYFDFSKWDSMGAGSAAEIMAGEDLKAELLNISDTDSSEGILRL